MTDRETVAHIYRTNGAYIIQWVGTLTDDSESSALFDAASALNVAKRVARQGALDLGYSGPFHWRQDGRLLFLEASVGAEA